MAEIHIRWWGKNQTIKGTLVGDTAAGVQIIKVTEESRSLGSLVDVKVGDHLSFPLRIIDYIRYDPPIKVPD